MTATMPAGLSLWKGCGDWKIIHDQSRKPIHSGTFRLKRDAVAATSKLAPLGIDWDQPSDRVLAAIDQLPAGRAGVERLLTPPEERERRIRASQNCVRYLKALEADGVTVATKTSHGLGGTTYDMTCGCVRLFSVPFMHFTASPEPDEDLITRCGRHTDLSIPAEPTDFASCVAAVRDSSRISDRHNTEGA